MMPSLMDCAVLGVGRDVSSIVVVRGNGGVDVECARRRRQGIQQIYTRKLLSLQLS